MTYLTSWDKPFYVESLSVGDVSTDGFSVDGDGKTNTNFSIDFGPSTNNWVAAGSTDPTVQQYSSFFSPGSDKQIMFGTTAPNVHLTGDPNFTYDYTQSFPQFTAPRFNRVSLSSNYTYQSISNSLVVTGDLDLTLSYVGVTTNTINAPIRKFFSGYLNSGAVALNSTTFDQFGEANQTRMGLDTSSPGGFVITFDNSSIAVRNSRFYNDGTKTHTYIINYFYNFQDSGTNFDTFCGLSANPTFTGDTGQLNGSKISGRRSVFLCKNTNFATEIYGHNMGCFNRPDPDGKAGQTPTQFNGNAIIVLNPGEYFEVYANASSGTTLYPNFDIFIVEI